jgi:L-2,4-diaminobutyric acid acetyltransferase
MLIRNFTSSDVPIIREIARDAGNLAVHHPHVYWMMTYTSPHLCLLAEQDGVPLGYVSGLTPFLDSHTCFLWQIAVTPASRRRNLGTDLAVGFFERAIAAGSRRMMFTIEANNAPSLGLFNKVAGIFESRDSMKCIGTTGDLGTSAAAENIYEIWLAHSSAARPI